jgi:hypothetical protein
LGPLRVLCVLANLGLPRQETQEVSREVYPGQWVGPHLVRGHLELEALGTNYVELTGRTRAQECRKEVKAPEGGRVLRQ